MSYNLDENIEDSFEFILSGIKYRMRYPTTEEIEKQGKMTDTQAGAFMFTFIEPVDNAALPIEDCLKKANIKKLKGFNNMIQTEFMSGGA